jgi:hypothetical protein
MATPLVRQRVRLILEPEGGRQRPQCLDQALIISRQ